MTAEDSPSVPIRLAGAHELWLKRDGAGDDVAIVTAQGAVALRIRVTEAGVDVEIGGSNLVLRSEGELTLDARRLALWGREGLELRSHGALLLEAEEQRLVATLGDVAIEANDDVCLDGERVLLNSPKPSR